MKSFIVLALFAAVAVAVPVVDPKTATIEEYTNDNIGVGEFKYSYKTSDGKQAYEQGVLKNVGTENEAMEVRGSFTYQDNEGKVFTVEYVANENGFQASGAHLPTV